MRQVSREPLISVVLPCFNAGDYIHEALLSITNQTYKKLEIIVIDDGSTDNSLSVVRGLLKLDQRISLFENKFNFGLIQTLNRGIDMANGELIARMDADDISSPERIEVELRALQMWDADVVSVGAVLIDKDGVHVGNRPVRCKSSKGCYYSSFFATPILHAAALARAEVLKKNRFLLSENTVHSEDYHLWCELLSQGYDFRNLPIPLYKIRLREQSVSRKFEEVQIKNHLGISNNHIHRYFGIEPDQSSLAVLNNRHAPQWNIRGINSGLKLLNKLTIQFNERENLSSDERSEIARVRAHQIIDIIIQSILKGTISVRTYSLYLTVRNFFLIFSRTNLSYILSKF